VNGIQGNLVRIRFSLILIAALCLAVAGAAAQSDAPAVSDAACAPLLDTIWTTATAACVAGPVGYVCNGGSAPAVDPAGAVAGALASVGALVDLNVVNALQTPSVNADTQTGGVAWLRLPEPERVTALLIGGVAVENVTPPDFPAWKSMRVVTALDEPVCPSAPRSALVVQTPPGVSAGIVINGASLVLNGTVMVQTGADSTIFIALTGQSRVLALGQEQPLITGQQLAVPHAPGEYNTPTGAPSFAEPLDTALIQGFPVALLDQPVALPQPGYVATAGQVNMRAAPATTGDLLLQVPAGTLLSVLGRNPAGDWLHVRLDSGETGWMFAELLQQYTGSVQAVYEATPVPPQRYGVLGQTARVIAPSGLNLRSAPEVTFGVLLTLPLGTEVTLLARSPYSPWVKVRAGETVGWAALITLETQALIDALPVDYDVPPPPLPTRIPGSFGNAFPDPNRSNP
jgi:uncharacterized protein YraI